MNLFDEPLERVTDTRLLRSIAEMRRLLDKGAARNTVAVENAVETLRQMETEAARRGLRFSS